MRALVAYGSKRGGTEGLADMVPEGLRSGGFDAVVTPAREARDVGDFDLVVVGGALYAMRWHRDATRLVRRNAKALKGVPTYLFSSGPLGEDAETHMDRPPVRGVARLMRTVGARGHRTFGGRLASDARGFVAAKMARTMAGDWRESGDVRVWAHDVAAQVRASSIAA